MRVIQQLRALVTISIKRLLAQPLLSISTFIGLVVASSLMITVPLYAEAVSFRILKERLSANETNTNRPPFSFLFSYVGSWAEPVNFEDLNEIDTYISEQVPGELGLPMTRLVRHVESVRMRLYPAGINDYANPDSKLADVTFGWTEDIESHIVISEGAFPADADPAPDSTVDILVREALATSLGMQVGETYYVYDANESQNTIPVRIAGIWNAANEMDSYWFYNPNAFDDALLVSRGTYINRLSPYTEADVNLALWYMNVDGNYVTTSRVDELVTRYEAVEQRIDVLLPSTYVAHSPVDELKPYQRTAGILTLLLTTFSVPIITLVLVFLTLVIGLSVEKRRAETAVLRSRGSAPAQLLGFIVIESLLLGTVAAIVGLVLSMVFTNLMGSVRSFMDFSSASDLNIVFTNSALNTVFLAIGLSVIIHIIPTLGAVQHTIISYKQATARTLQRPIWQRFGIDILFMLVTAYFYYQLTQQASMFSAEGATALEQASSNPILFLLPPITIFAFTLFVLRFMPIFVRIIAWIINLSDRVGILIATRHLERTPGFYILPSILLVCTISLGIFTASFAHTLDRHLYEQEFYELAGDLTIRSYVSVATGQPGGLDLIPIDLLISEYREMEAIDAATRLGEYTAIVQGDQRITSKFIGVDRAEFGEVSFWREDFAGWRLGTLMNALASVPESVIVSRQFMQDSSLVLNDFVRLNVQVGQTQIPMTLQIVGVVDYFPFWYEGEDGPLFVGNLDYLFEQAGTELDYMIVARTTPDINYDAFVKEMNSKGASVVFYREPFSSINRTQAQPERQGLFGILSIGFISSVMITVIGFFLYTLFSYQRRFVELGVLRAIGLSQVQMIISVVWELGLLVILGLGLGILLGLVVSWMYIPHLQIATRATDLVPPYLVTIAWGEIAQLIVLFALLFIAILIVLLVALRRMRVFQAIKLGETV